MPDVSDFRYRSRRTLRSLDSSWYEIKMPRSWKIDASGTLLTARKRDVLQNAGIAEWDLDAWYLLEDVTRCEPAASIFWTHERGSVRRKRKTRYRQNRLTREASHIPLQHLTGAAGVHGPGHSRSTKMCWSPDRTPEVLVEEALNYVQARHGAFWTCVPDPGCILLSVVKLGAELKCRREAFTGTGVDLSRESSAGGRGKCRAALGLEKTTALSAERPVRTRCRGTYDMIRVQSTIYCFGSGGRHWQRRCKYP